METPSTSGPVPQPQIKVPATAVFLQDACLQHRYIRSRDTSNIVELPERLRAVKLGIAAAVARLEDEHNIISSSSSSVEKPNVLTTSGSTASIVSAASTNLSTDSADDLAAALGDLNIASSSISCPSTVSEELLPSSNSDTPPPLRIFRSSAKVDILNNAAVKYVHGDIEGDVYLEKLRDLARDSAKKIKQGQSEIPDGWFQGDLYLCPQSLDAMQGALGTVCEAVDTVIRDDNPTKRAFVSIRPPGHHCGEDTPSGFCFVNNVAVGAAHAHLKHNIKRILIFDIDLHHGNGTQSIAWQINEETYRSKIETEAAGVGAPPPPLPGAQIFYGSVHDILSYPCEDGKPHLVQAASVSIHGPHGQYIENVHLEPYESETQFFDVLYKGAYSRLLTKAREFVESTGEGSDDVLVFISCGFDASEHEYPSMSRHARKVPTSFFHRFTLDACAFASQYAKGRLISVLEGGYSGRALLSGGMAHIVGLVDAEKEGEGQSVEELTRSRERWWSKENVLMLEKLTKKPSRRAPRSSTGKPSSSSALPNSLWFARTAALLELFDPASNYPSSSANKAPLVPPSTRTLRTRSPNPMGPKLKSPGQSPKGIKSAGGPRGKSKGVKEEVRVVSMSESTGSSLSMSEDSVVDVDGGLVPEVKVESVVETKDGDDRELATPISVSASAQKKLPRVVLKLGSRPGPEV